MDSTPSSEEAAAVRERMARYAHFLDTFIPIPGTRLRIGVEPLLGLVPVAGDIAGLLFSSLLIYEAQRIGAPRRVLLRMAANTLIDSLLGAIPLFGDIFDFAFKSNRRNVQLLHDHAARIERGDKPVSMPLLIALVGGMVGVVALAWWLAVQLFVN